MPYQSTKKVTLFTKYTVGEVWYMATFDNITEANERLTERLGNFAGRPIAYAIERDLPVWRTSPLPHLIIPVTPDGNPPPVQEPKASCIIGQRLKLDAFVLFKRFSEYTTHWMKKAYATEAELLADLNEAKRLGVMTSYSIERSVSEYTQVPDPTKIVRIMPVDSSSSSSGGIWVNGRKYGAGSEPASASAPVTDRTVFTPEDTLSFVAELAEVSVVLTGLPAYDSKTSTVSTQHGGSSSTYYRYARGVLDDDDDLAQYVGGYYGGRRGGLV